MAAKLLIEEGDLKGISLSFENGDAWIIGRDPDECQLVIEDPLVSRKHLVARRTPEGIIVENLSQTNPVLLNDEDIGQESRLLQNGDTLKIGNEVLRFYEESSAQVIDDALDVLKTVTTSDEPNDSDPSNESNEDNEDNTINNENEEDMTHNEKDLDNEQPENEPQDNGQEGDHTENEELVEDEELIAMPDDEEHAAESNSSLTPSSTEAEEEPRARAPHDRHDRHDTIFGEEADDAHGLAEIDFGVIDTGRWLLKVIGGPNSGAEFYMHPNNQYVIGTDPQSCDIVFHDTSVSRQHARITVTPEDALLIEDLRSRNGIMINGNLVEEKQSLTPSTIVTVGTTSFVVYDREGEMQTIISPLLPSIVKVLQQEVPTTAPLSAPPTEGSQSTEGKGNEDISVPPQPVEVVQPVTPSQPIGPYIILSAIIGLFALAGIGTSLLFHEEPVVMQTQENANELIQQALSSFPSIRWTFNKSNGSLLLLGHVTTAAEKNRIFYNLGDLKFIKNLDDNGIIIDEGVLGEVNSLLANNPEWRGIRVYSSEPGQFILSGTLKTRKQAEQLSSYLSVNFPYLDLLKKQIVVEEDVMAHIQEWLHDAQLSDIAVKMTNGEVGLTGSFPTNKMSDLSAILVKIKQIPGVRVISNQTQPQTAETGIVDLSDHYQITGKSRLGDKLTVVINGHILSEGDDLDGMTITKISPNLVQLKKDKDKFRIEY